MNQKIGQELKILSTIVQDTLRAYPELAKNKNRLNEAIQLIFEKSKALLDLSAYQLNPIEIGSGSQFSTTKSTARFAIGELEADQLTFENKSYEVLMQKKDQPTNLMQVNRSPRKDLRPNRVGQGPISGHKAQNASAQKITKNRPSTAKKTPHSNKKDSPNGKPKAANPTQQNAYTSTKIPPKPLYLSTPEVAKRVDLEFNYGQRLSSFFTEKRPTIIHFKNPASYMAIQFGHGSLLVDKGKKRYFSTNKPNGYWDLTSIDDYYYLYEASSGIWKKRLDETDPKLILKITLNNKGFGRSFCVGNKGRFLIANRKQKEVLAIKITERGQLGEITPIDKDHKKGVIMDFKLLGKAMDQILVLTSEGQLRYHHFHFEAKKSLNLVKKNIPGITPSQETPVTLTIDSAPVPTFACVNTAKKGNLGSRIFIIDLKTLAIRSIYKFADAVPCYETAVLVAYSPAVSILSVLTSKNSTSTCYEINHSTKVVSERLDLKKHVGADGVGPLQQIGDRVFGCDFDGKLIDLRYHFKAQ